MLRKVLLAASVVVAVIAVVAVAAVATGYIVVGDPATAAGQVLTGDFEDPNVTVEETRVGPVGAPEGSIEDVDRDGATVSNRIRVENPNHLGGRVRSVEYDVYLSGNRQGPYEYLGNGSVRDLTVPPNGTVTETNEFDVAYEDLVRATGKSGVQGLAGGGTWYARVEGEAAIALGPASFSVEFEKVSELS